MREVFLSVVIPSYDEMANLRKGVLEKIDSFLRHKKYTYEVLIVDDGSRDRSVEFVEKFCKEHPYFKLITNPHYGKAGAVTTGMLAAKGEYRLFTDMDQATPIEEVDKLLPFLENKEYDIVIGSRPTRDNGSPMMRVILHEGMIIVRKIIVGIPSISDTQCGFKIFTAGSAEHLFGKIFTLRNGFKKISGSAVKAGFDVELLFMAEKMGYKIKEVPVEWLYVETRRVNPIRDSLEAVKDLFKIRTNNIRMLYNHE